MSPVLNSGLFILIIVLFLFSPAPVKENEFCVSYVKMNHYMGFVVNCDTSSYLIPAQNPKILLEKKTTRQSRPLYIFIGAIVGRLIGTVIKSNSIELYYWSFIVINFIIITISIKLYNSILIYLDVNKYLIFISSVYLICNDVVKIYFWSATPQLFGIFTPIFAIYIGLILIKKKDISKQYLVCFSILLGLLPMMYGNFIVIGFIVLLACYYNFVKLKILSITSIIKYGIVILIFFALPSTIWIIIVTSISGGYFNPEIEVFREIIWILDSLECGIDNFVLRFLENTSNYFSTIISFDILPFISLLLLSSAYLILNMKDIKQNLKNSPSSELQAYLLISSIIAFFFFFFWILGYYATRLTFTLVPALIMFIIIVLNRIIKRVEFFYKSFSFTSILIITVIWCYYHIIKYGPFS